jgi:hypothetical protein
VKPPRNSGSAFEKVGECPYRYKSSSAYYARIKKNGKEIRQTLKTQDRAIAKRRLADEQRVRQQVRNAPSHVLNGWGRSDRDWLRLITTTICNFPSELGFTSDGSEPSVLEWSSIGSAIFRRIQCDTPVIMTHPKDVLMNGIEVRP